MKAKDIKLNEEYAIEMYGGYFVRGYVVRVGDVTRTVHSGSRSFHGHKSTSKMVSFVRLQSHDGQANGKVEHVVLAKVKCTWAEHAVQEQARNERRSNIDDAYKTVESELERLTGVRVYFSRHTTDRHASGFASIGVSDVRKIIDAIKQEVVA